MNLHASVKKFDTVYKAMKRRYREEYRVRGMGGYRGLAVEFGGITPALAQAIVVHKYEPKTNRPRFILGLSELKPAPACYHCGEVHYRRGECPQLRLSRKADGQGVIKVRQNWRGLALWLAGVLIYLNICNRQK